MVRAMNSNKLTDLLLRYEMRQRIVDTPKHFHSVMERSVDWIRVNATIAVERERTVRCLMENLRSCLKFIQNSFMGSFQSVFLDFFQSGNPVILIKKSERTSSKTLHNIYID